MRISKEAKDISLKLSAEDRIKKRAEFQFIQNNGKKLHSKHFLFIILDNKDRLNRLGLTVTLKVDKRAAARNRLKRRLREIFRNIRSRFNSGFNMVIIARQNATELDFDQINSEFISTMTKYKLLTNE